MISRSAVRSAVTVTLSYFLSLFLLLAITGIILMRTAVSPEYTLRQVDRSGYSAQVLTELRYVYISYGLASGIPRDFMASLVTSERVDDAVKSSIRGAFGIGAGYSFDWYADELTMSFRDFALSRDIAYSEELETGLRDLAVLCADALREHTDSPIFGIISETLRFRQMLFIAIIVSIFASIICIILIPLVNKRVTKWIDGYLYAFGAALLVCAVLPLTAAISGITSRLNVMPLSINRFLTSWLDGVIYGYLIALIPLLLFTGLFTFIRVVRQLRRRRRYL
jgi:hypothetical protein